MNIPITFMDNNGQGLNQYPAPQQQQYEQKNSIQIDDKPIGLNLSHLTSAGGVTLQIAPDTPEPKKRKTRTRKVGNTEIVSANQGEVQTGFEDTYKETTAVIRGAIAQFDVLSGEIKQDLDEIRRAKTMRGKYQYISLLSGSLVGLLNGKVSAVRELNSSITKANELNYKRDKDTHATNSMDDDKMIMDMYKAFVSNPIGAPGGASVLGPSSLDMTLAGTGIVRVDGGSNQDMGYQNYLNNITPEQNLMRYEADPNVKQVVVYDKATGKKWFQVMNTVTGEAINNVPVRDQMFMEDTTLNMNTGLATNNNLKEVYPIVVINADAFSEY